MCLLNVRKHERFAFIVYFSTTGRGQTGESVVVRVRIVLAVLLLPPGDVLELALFAARKVLGVLGLLQRMPVVEDPVGRNDLAFVRTAAGAVGDCVAWRIEDMDIILIRSGTKNSNRI